MKLIKKEYMNIYLVGAVITAAFIFMIVSTWKIFNDVGNQSSVDIAIDKTIDGCWEEKNLDEKGLPQQ